jgi:hypothetical protein
MAYDEAEIEAQRRFEGKGIWRTWEELI